MDEIEEEDVEELIDKNTREELDKMALKEGIKNPKRFSRKEEVAREILKAKKAKKYVKKPTGLYIDSED